MGGPTGKTKDAILVQMFLAEEQGCWARVNDLAQVLGKRENTVSEHLGHLTDYGLVVEQDQRGRRTLTPKGRARAETLIPRPQSLAIRGRIAAGPALPLLDETEEFISFPSFDPATHFILTVQGDSMVSFGIMDGDLVVIRRVPSWLDVREGAIVAALVPEGTGADGEDWLDRLAGPLDDSGMQTPPLDHITLKRFDRRFSSYMHAGKERERVVARLRGSAATFYPVAVAIIGVAVHRYGAL